MSTETQVGAPDVFEEQQRGRLVKSMRLFDLVFFGITTVAVIVLLTLCGPWLGSVERRGETGAVRAREDIRVDPA